MQYFWALLVLLPALIESGLLESLFSSEGQNAPVFELPPIAMSPVVGLFIAVIMAALLLGTLVAIIRAPKAIVRTGDLIVHRATRIAVPAVTHHKELSKKRRVVLNRRVTFLVQVVLALLPLCASPFLPEIEDVQKEVVLIVSALLAVLSLGAFTASWLISGRPTSRTRSHGSRG